METNGFRGKQHTFSLAEQIAGGRVKSLIKKLAVQQNPLKNRRSITKKLAEKIEIQGGDITALKGLLKLSSTAGGQALIDTMIDTLVHMKEIVDDEPTLQKYDTFMKNLVLFKSAVWGTRLEIVTDDKKQLLSEFKQKLKTVEAD